MSPSTRRTLAQLDDAVVFVACVPLVLVVAARVLVRRALHDAAPPEAAGPISISVSFPVDVMPPKCAPSTSQSTPTA